MKSGLNAQQLEAFEQDGFLIVEGVLALLETWLFHLPPVGTATRITESVLDVR